MNIIISGCTCSGKTTFANELKKEISNSIIISQDYYFKDLSDVPKSQHGYLLDSPNAFHKQEFITDIETLLKSGKTNIPSYDIDTNKRLNKSIIVTKQDINIIEGLQTIDFLKNLKQSLKIYMNTPLDVCLKRRINKAKKYNINEQIVIDYFNKCVLPMYNLYIKNQIQYADYIIESEEEKLCLLKKLIN